MLSLSYLKEYIMVSIALSTVTCAFIQKTKGLIKPKSLIIWYSFFVNILFSIIFCQSFTKINFPDSLWTGLFSFIGADTLYKSLEGKLSSYTEIRSTKEVGIKKENILNKKEG